MLEARLDQTTSLSSSTMSSTSNQPEGGSLTIRPTKPLEHDPALVRELIVGPDHPVAPYPIYLDGWVERGFGRGSKDLGCPTGMWTYYWE